MVGPKLYHLKHTRQFVGFKDPSQALNQLIGFIGRHDFRCRVKHSQFARGRQRGININHVAKFKLHVTPNANGYVVSFDYYCKVKLGTAIVVGVLTSGISTAVGVGTLAMNMLEADKFVDHFWQYADSIAVAPAVIITVERWGNDGKGNMVLQPVVAVQPVAVQPVAVQPVGVQPVAVQQVTAQPVVMQASPQPTYYTHHAYQSPQQQQPVYYSPQQPQPQYYSPQQQHYAPPQQYPPQQYGAPQYGQPQPQPQQYATQPYPQNMYPQPAYQQQPPNYLYPQGKQ